MNLYNSLTKKIESFVPIIDNRVSIYSCGPTVYNLLHIGNLSAFIYADTLGRVLEFDYSVRQVMNITDVDDKTIRDGARDYPDSSPEEALNLLTTKYTKIFKEDLKETGNNIENIEFVSAVDSIQEMIELIQELLNKNIAYPANDGIYFSINKYQNSGRTYGVLQNIIVANSEERIKNDEYDKDNVSDFALWKKLQPGEPSWKATFTFKNKEYDMEGRPGWHIECSAMSRKLLGVPFDIHTGGIDLKFPHHENEIAQTCGAGASKLANYFVHNNHILVDGKKMSKSLGNFYTLADVKEKNFSALDFRVLVLESHYRSESNFSWEILVAAHNRLSSINEFADKQFQTTEDNSSWVSEALKIMNSSLLSALKDDLNTPVALAELSKVITNNSTSSLGQNEYDKFKELLTSLDRVFGLNLLDRNDLTVEQKNTLASRTQARTNKDWPLSDKLRDELLEQKIALRDSNSNVQTWYRV